MCILVLTASFNAVLGILYGPVTLLTPIFVVASIISSAVTSGTATASGVVIPDDGYLKSSFYVEITNILLCAAFQDVFLEDLIEYSFIVIITTL